MNTKPHLRPHVSQPRRAVALIIVLAILLLMSALLVAFMGTVSNEREASRSMTAGFEAKQGYETAVNLAISQIREATKNDDGTVGWASQPGAIQTFGSGANANMVYKLYSSDVMQQARASWKPGTPAESGFDPAKPTVTAPGFVDINTAVYITAPQSTPANPLVEPHYPIVDPRAGLDVNGVAVAAPGTGIVSGFSSTNIPHATLKEIRGVSTVPVLQLPMRVRWIYQLKDGALVAPDATDILQGASKENPPVTRFAFWTDDESAKINVNTASEYTYWDTPLASSYTESGEVDSSGHMLFGKGKTDALAASQPTKKEYQRFPGHPATNCLSPALRWLFPASVDPFDSAFKEAIYHLAPRMTGGFGSTMSATRCPEFDTDYRQYDRDRLFATLDEYWFRPDRSPISYTGFYPVFTTDSVTPQKDPIFLDPAKFTPAALEKLRFFLTAVSRAPDLNLYGMPRITIWPVHEIDNSDPLQSKRSGYDDLIVFCSTIATKPYIFSRANPWSTIYDYETSGAQTHNGASLNINANRNRDLIEKYLKRLAAMPVPATGTAFTSSAKYGTVGPGGYTEMDQIFLEMFDYIRCNNIVDTGRKDSTSPGFPLAYTLGYSPVGDFTGNTKPDLGSGQVSPTVHYDASGKPTIKGFGRFDTVSELGLIFYEDRTALPLDPSGAIESPAPIVAASTLSFRCAIITELFTVSPGYPALSEGFAYTIRETKPFTVSSTDGTFSQPLSLAEDRATPNINFIGVDAWRSYGGRFFMPTRGLSSPFLYDKGIVKAGDSSNPWSKDFSKPSVTNTGTEAEYSKYPFYSKRIDMPTAAGVDPTEFVLSDGTLTIDIYPLDIPTSQMGSPSVYAKANLKQPIQTLTITFPRVTLPTPQRDPGAVPLQARSVGAPGGRGGQSDAGHPVIIDKDVVRSMEINGNAKGDTRHVAGLANPPADYYAASGDSGDYANKTIRIVHNFHNGWGTNFANAKWGTLTPNAPTRGANKMPDVPKSINGVLSPDNSMRGDFDRGLSKHTDGPFINKPDEANVRFNLADNLAGGGALPYYRGGNGTENPGEKYFSPNRLMPSAVMFGSLPSGLISKRPWETLLFCPPTGAGHKGAVSPADHYLLDLFTIPVVEPFAISEPLSTMGKINLNARLAPFGYAKDTTGRSYIERNTGLHSVLKGMKQFVAANTAAESGHTEEPLKNSLPYRFDIDPYLTIDKAITPRFDVGGIGFFKCASEICEVDLLMSSGVSFTDPTPAARMAFWQANSMTGDNAREKPYALIYPRLTTKSNVYTVHVWSQSLLKNPNSSSDEWKKFDDNRDKITGEYRGSTTIERFLDANDPALVPASGGAPYDAVDASAKGLDPYYRFRILSSKRFTMQ